MTAVHAPDTTVSDVDTRRVPEISSERRALAKYAVEAIGTFILVFTVGAAVGSRNSLAPLAIGAALMVMIYAGGHISGGNYNPAVTLAVLVRRRIGLRDAVGYWIAQLGAGIVAALSVDTVIHPVQSGTTATTLTGPTTLAAFVAELLFTFALCYVVLNVATSKAHPDNSFYGLAIGFTVVAGAVAVGGISGGAFNPAVSLGAAVMHMFAWSTLWVYLVAQLIAGAAAGVTFRLLNPDDIEIDNRPLTFSAITKLRCGVDVELDRAH